MVLQVGRRNTCFDHDSVDKTLVKSRTLLKLSGSVSLPFSERGCPFELW
jgi:hypothetical protein